MQSDHADHDQRDEHQLHRRYHFSKKQETQQRYQSNADTGPDRIDDAHIDGLHRQINHHQGDDEKNNAQDTRDELGETIGELHAQRPDNLNHDPNPEINPSIHSLRPPMHSCVHAIIQAFADTGFRCCHRRR